jgi:cyclase
VFNEKEVDELILLDIDATAQDREPDYELLRCIAIESRMPLCYGGGVTNARQAARLISLGYEKVSVSNAAVRKPELVREMADAVGTQSVVVTLDVRRMGLFGRYSAFTHNGRHSIKKNPVEIAMQVEELGAGEICFNSIDRDGVMQGYDLEFARATRKALSVPLTFIGGAGNIGHMRDLIDSVGVVGAGAGSMFVFNGVYRAVLISYARP